MSLNRYAKKRDLNEREIVDALRKAGATVVQLDRPVDLLVGYRRRTVLIEVKSKGGKLNEAQREFFGDWRGGDLLTVWSVEQALLCITGDQPGGNRIIDNRDAWERGPNG